MLQMLERKVEKMNKNDKKVIKIVMAAIIVVSFFAIFTPTYGYFRPVPIPSGEKAIYYLSPCNSNTSGYCDSTEAELHVNSSMGLGFGKVSILYDHSCGDITGVTFNTAVWDDPIGTGYAIPYLGKLVITYSTLGNDYPPGDYPICNITIHCNSTEYCKTDLNFVYETYITNETIPPWDFDVPGENGTFTCGEPTEETYSKDLYEGWNLVSLPLTPSDNSASGVLSTVSYDAVYRYDAASKQFESAGTMDPGIGYFVHVTQNCTWTYSGTPYTSMSTELKQGLNMVGWLNCSEDITDALSSIAGDYWYVAMWNAVSQSFEVYNPVAPSSFNDFTAMDRGTGYFLSLIHI